MNNTPLVTVLLLTYNHIDSFQKAIQSVLEQKTSFPFQIIVLDDASTDGTSELVKIYRDLPNVKVVIREQNSDGKNLYWGLKEVNTEYYAILETDDYWCDDTKLQQQFEALELNPDCSMCAHNTLVNYVNTGKNKKYMNVPTKIFEYPPKRLTKSYFIEPHTSSRLYRSSCLNLSEIKNPIVATYDIASNFYFLTKGNLYYIDKIMSVYNYTTKGIYSGVSSYQQRYKSAFVIKQLNEEFEYRYNYLLARFFATRLNLSFLKYLILKFTRSPKKLERIYEKVLKNYEAKYLNNRDKKPVMQINIPINRKTSLVLEIRREKDRV